MYKTDLQDLDEWRIWTSDNRFSHSVDGKSH